MVRILQAYAINITYYINRHPAAAGSFSKSLTMSALSSPSLENGKNCDGPAQSRTMRKITTWITNLKLIRSSPAGILYSTAQFYCRCWRTLLMFCTGPILAIYKPFARVILSFISRERYSLIIFKTLIILPFIILQRLAVPLRPPYRGIQVQLALINSVSDQHIM